MTVKYYSSKVTAEKLGVCRKTLQTWAKANKIDFIVTEGGWRKYDLDGYLKSQGKIIKKKICYCRVSSYDRKENLENQISYLKLKYPNHSIISDIGSGINFKRKGLKEILDLAIKNLLIENKQY